MRLKKIQVEEGFLDGLTLTFSNGLNVIIGPRGSGKTSVIELIRYCLRVPSFNDEVGLAVQQHASGILGSGRVTVTVEVDGRDQEVSRTRDSSDRSSLKLAELPIILSQGEIERVGLSPQSKRMLIDLIGLATHSRGTTEDSLVSDEALVKSLTVELRSLNDELLNLQQQIAAVTKKTSELRFVEDQLTESESVNLHVSKLRSRIEVISKSIASNSAKERAFERALRATETWHGELNALIDRCPQLEELSSLVEENEVYGQLRMEMAEIVEKLGDASSAAWNVAHNLKAERDRSLSQRLECEQDARATRQEMETIQEGAGTVAKQLSEYRESQALHRELSVRAEQTEASVRKVAARRDEVLGRLKLVREQRFKQRDATSQRLNKLLEPRIRVKIERNASFDKYSEVIIGVLRGSGIHYNVVAPLLAQRISPYELAVACESDDWGFISNATGMDADRSRKVASLIRSHGVADILMAPVEDDIKMMLHTGKNTVPTEQLSTGQRCTVILPILLNEASRPLIIDQPEDNLDNAYIVDTVIRSMRDRTQSGQVICSTHNANVPVLGNAKRVVVMKSDGRRGYVASAAALEDDVSVAAITDFMEGGKEAFARRAEFYSTKMGIK
jgi:energy-coupling factor transporter ATP-binding protein EcfA2